MLLGTAPLITTRFRVTPDSVRVTVSDDAGTEVVSSGSMVLNEVSGVWEYQFQTTQSHAGGDWMAEFLAVKDGFTGRSIKRFRVGSV